MKKLNLQLSIIFVLIFGTSKFAQKVNEFPTRDDPLNVKVDMYDKLILGNHWNEGTIMQHVIFPPAGLDRPIVGSQADCLDATSEMLAAYSHKYFLSKNPSDQKIANQIFEGILKLEKVTGVPGLVARSFNKTDVILWHEILWYPEWHWSSSLPEYRWLGDLSADKFTSIFYGLGTFWEFCADENYKQEVAGLLDRFMGRIVDNNFKLTDLDDKMTLWGNFCPDLPHQALNSLEMLMGLKVAYCITGKERYNAAYNMLIDKYHYDDHQILSKIIWPEEWRNKGDDYHAARSLYMLMRFEKDNSLLIKYRMNLNRHWYVWQNHDFTFEDDIWFIMVYHVLTGEDIFTEEREQAIKDMWGFERRSREFQIPTEDGIKIIESEEEGIASAMIRNYWFGRHYGLIDKDW
jgi:hypothetical protein